TLRFVHARGGRIRYRGTLPASGLPPLRYCRGVLTCNDLLKCSQSVGQGGRPRLQDDRRLDLVQRAVSHGRYLLKTSSRGNLFTSVDHPEFLQSYERARDIRANAAFAEQQLEIADNVSDDWSFNPDNGKLSVKKEAMLRSKIRSETRQWQIARRHPQEWGDRETVDIKND